MFDSPLLNSSSEHWVDRGSRSATLPVINPATGELLATVPDMGVAETVAAIEASQ